MIYFCKNSSFINWFGYNKRFKQVYDIVSIQNNDLIGPWLDHSLHQNYVNKK